MKVVAVVGLSGVGKTRVLKELSEKIPFLHLQASQIIKNEQVRRHGSPSTSEQLRSGQIIDNQRLLISGFEYQTANCDSLVVFDGHVVIDAGSSIIEIPSSIFKALKCESLVVLTDDPSDLVRRRLADRTRVRPLRSRLQIERQQTRMIEVAQRIACELSIPCCVLSIGDGKLARIIQSNH